MAKKVKKIIDAERLRDIETYEHKNQQRSNNPPVGMAQYDTMQETASTYAFDPHLDPTLQWAGKTEGMSFSVPTSAIHIHESIKPHKIIKSVQVIDDESASWQMSMFDDPVERMKRRREAIEFYKHGVDWTNRMIAGDSLVIMNSLLEKEGMSGQVQMVYIDPPYGIKYGSNFQPFVNKRDVRDGKDEDLTQEPEMIKAFRDTWELGIHSYLTYLRNRLLLARELLADSGSVFVQISDENVHLVRCLCDEIFGNNNFISLIQFYTTGGFATNTLSRVGDYIIWYAKDSKQIKYHQLYTRKLNSNASWILFADGTYRGMTKEEQSDLSLIPKDARIYSPTALTSSGESKETPTFVFEGKKYRPASANHWKTSIEGLERLAQAGRIHVASNSLRYRRFADDFPYQQYTTIWSDTGTGSFTDDKQYVVQTSPKVIARCLLMTTDPGDLVLDITCGSGTTAYVAEQWGRRWITCDTSRVAITLAKQRLMTATYDYYKLAHEEQGVGSGFIYKTVPHITLKSIANNEPPARETLYDQPEIDKTKIRITGPFTLEALPAPVVKPLDDTSDYEDNTAKHTNWKDELLATGILGRNGAKIEFSRVETLQGTQFLHAEAETKEETPRRAVICFAGETKPMDSRMVSLALDEVEAQRPKPKLVVFAAFQFDPEASKDIDETNYPGVTLLKVQMNTDLMTDDLKKKRSSNQSFWLVGQPDVELVKTKKYTYKVKVNGFDYYDVKSGTVTSGNASRIAMWMLDINYDGLCIEPVQVFFPMGGKNDGWNKLAKTLKAEIDQELIEKYAGNESLPFTVKEDTKIAIKIVDDRGIESMKVIPIKVGE